MKRDRGILFCIFGLILILGALRMEVKAEEIDVGEISIGMFHNALIKADDSLWMWGSNACGELGDGTGNNSFIPIKVLDGVEQVDLNEFTSMAIKKDGSLWGWGNNEYGQMGNGNTTNIYTPQKILDGVKQVSLGLNHCAAIKEDGSLWIWGANSQGQLGNGSTDNSLLPIKVLDDVVCVSLGTYHSAAIKKDGSLWMWGSDSAGQLGDGKESVTYRSLVPIKILEDVIGVELGYNCSAAIKKDGSLWMWGENLSGKLGDGTKVYRYVPTKILDDVANVRLGYLHSAAIKKDGSLWMWGDNNDGKLGDGTENDSVIPIKVLENVKQAGAGYYHSIALKKDGSLWGWGHNNAGQLSESLSSVVPKEIMSTLVTYTINYNANGGTGAPAKQTKYYDKALTLRTKTPTRKNYVFQGWATTKTATKAAYKAGGTYKLNKDVTLYAVWKKNQTITASNKMVTYKSAAFNLNAKASGGGKLTYTSGNQKVATVSATGKVTIKGYGKATITIKAAAKGEYLAASKKITITVNPKKITLKSLSSPSTKKLNITWVKDTTVTGYKCQISTSSKFVTNKTHKTYQKTYAAKASMPVKVSNLVKGKTYYVRVRAYKNVNGTTYYGAWSTVKKIKVK